MTQREENAKELLRQLEEDVFVDDAQKKDEEDKCEKILDRLINSNAKERDIVLYLADNVPLTELARDYYQLYMKVRENESPTPICISQSDFDKHFRIIGFRSNGEPETRGRKAK